MKKWQNGKVLVTGVVVFLALFPMGRLAASPMRVQVVNGDVRSVLLSAAKMGHFNLVLDDEVKGTVTLDMTEEPDRVMHLVASAKGLILFQDGEDYIVTVGSRTGRLSHVHSYKVRYANPHDLAQAVNLSLLNEGKFDSVLNKNYNDTKNEANANKTAGRTANRALVDETSGSVIFYGTVWEAQEVEAVLRKLDVPAEQVSLEAKVIALSRSASKDLGVEWQWSTLPQYPEYHKTRYKDRQSGDYTDTEIRRRFNGSEQIPGIIRFGHGPEGRPYEFYFSAKLNAMIADGKAKMLARPNITTLQGHEAVINIGGEVPVPTQSVTESSTTTTMTYRQTGIILRCIPRVNTGGMITAEVHTEVSSPLYVNDIKAYRFQKRSADTTVRLRDGETMVIGGLIGSDESRSMSKVPFIGDVPILGSFFRNYKRNHTESEIMIFLTAHILKDSGSTKDTGQCN